jgi:hypothetical protein
MLNMVINRRKTAIGSVLALGLALFGVGEAHSGAGTADEYPMHYNPIYKSVMDDACWHKPGECRTFTQTITVTSRYDSHGQPWTEPQK